MYVGKLVTTTGTSRHELVFIASVPADDFHVRVDR
jgi:hypothetical protein